MRREANIEEWKRLYEAAEKIKERKPWEYLWDRDLICLKEEGKPEKAGEEPAMGSVFTKDMKG